MPSVFKRTPARAKIVEFLYSAKSPVDVQDIIDSLRSKKLSINKATVYRTIDLLFVNGFVDRVEFGEGKFRYEIKKGDHHHIICKKCNAVEDIEDKYMSKLEEEIHNDRGFKVTNHSLEFFGICKNCQL